MHPKLAIVTWPHVPMFVMIKRTVNRRTHCAKFESHSKKMCPFSTVNVFLSVLVFYTEITMYYVYHILHLGLAFVNVHFMISHESLSRSLSNH